MTIRRIIEGGHHLYIKDGKVIAAIPVKIDPLPQRQPRTLSDDETINPDFREYLIGWLAEAIGERLNDQLVKSLAHEFFSGEISSALAEWQIQQAQRHEC